MGCYGFTIGLWRGWEMAGYVALKLPGAILLTLLINGLLNGLLGLVLGSGIGIIQSVQLLLSGFAIMSITLGALSPITFFLATNTPPPDDPNAALWFSYSKLIHTALITFAGVLAHYKLLAFVRAVADSSSAGTRTFFAWLLGNLFVGAQVLWILRPFFGSPNLEIELLRPNPFDGSFYETILQSASKIL